MCVDDYLHLRYHLEALKKRFHLTQLLFVVLSQGSKAWLWLDLPHFGAATFHMTFVHDVRTCPSRTTILAGQRLRRTAVSSFRVPRTTSEDCVSCTPGLQRNTSPPPQWQRYEFLTRRSTMSISRPTSTYLKMRAPSLHLSWSCECSRDLTRT